MHPPDAMSFFSTSSLPIHSSHSLAALFQSALLAGAALALTGCGSSMNTTLTKQWETEVGDKARTVAVDPQRGHLLVGRNKKTTLFDGQGGALRGGDSGGLSGLVDRAKQAADQMASAPSASQMSANQLDYVMLSDPGLALAFDYSATDDVIRAIDLENGQKQWEQTGYKWSLEKYRAAGTEVATEIAQQAGLASGVTASKVNSELTRSRYVENLVARVPGENAILLKTVTQLHRIDLATGEAAWSISDVLGSRLLGTQRLPSGDLILAVGNASLLDVITGSEQVLRLDPESGEVAWRSDHGARALRDLTVKDGQLLLTSTQGELMAYRLDDGTQTLKADPGWQMGQLSTLALTAEYRGTRFSAPLTSSPVLQNDQVYAPAVLDRQTVGDPDLGLHKYALPSGTQAWTSDPVETMRDVRDLTFADGHVIGRVTRGRPGALTGDSYQRVVAWNPADGSIAWNRRMPYTPSGVHAIRLKALDQAPLPTINLVTDGGRAYTLNDTSVVALDVASGEVTQHASVKMEGASAWLTEAGPGTLLVLREEGVEFRAAGDLSTTAEPISFDDELITFSQKGDHLFAQTEQTLYVVNVPRQTLTGTVTVKDAGGLVSGNLRRGYVATDDGQAVYILTEERLVQKYRIP